jgi:hypothetical protein
MHFPSLRIRQPAVNSEKGETGMERTKFHAIFNLNRAILIVKLIFEFSWDTEPTWYPPGQIEHLSRFGVFVFVGVLGTYI